MTIRATAALLLGTLAITAGATNDNLRGKNNKNNNNEVESRERVLIDMDMNMGLGEMVCKERVPIDGSVICTFRTMPPADMMTANVHHDCLYNSRTRTNFCLGMEVYRASFSDLPDATVVQQPVIPIQQRPVQQQPSVQPNPAVGFVGSCPSVPQATGMLCYQYVPVGSREVSCYFGRTQCNCALNDDPSVAEQWQCRPIPEDSFVGGGGGVVQTEPPPAPVQEEQEPPPVVTRPVVPNPAVTVVDTNPVTNIDAMVQNQVVNGKPVEINMASGNILPTFINPANCPATKPSDGDDCDWGQYCTYYTSETTAKDCLCDGDCAFRCVPSRRPELLVSF